MASYPDTEQALLDLLQAQCGYDDATASRGDYRVMDAPGADTKPPRAGAVGRPGTMTWTWTGRQPR